jgi:hypothetical protein
MFAPYGKVLAGEIDNMTNRALAGGPPGAMVNVAPAVFVSRLVA